MDISLDETRRIDALKMALEYGNSLGLDLEETIEAAKKFETYLKGEITAKKFETYLKGEINAQN